MENGSEREVRLRKLRADRELKEIKLAQIRSGLVSIEDVDRFEAELVSVTKARFMALGARLAPQLVEQTSRSMIQAIIERETRAVLHKLAEGTRSSAESPAPTGVIGVLESPQPRGVSGVTYFGSIAAAAPACDPDPAREKRPAPVYLAPARG